MPGFESNPSGRSGPSSVSVMPDGVKLLLERFPHVQMVSLQLLVNHEAFRELCEEYATCSAAADRHAERQGDEALRWEYNSLRLRLEGELLSYISQHGSNDAPR